VLTNTVGSDDELLRLVETTEWENENEGGEGGGGLKVGIWIGGVALASAVVSDHRQRSPNLNGLVGFPV
jgi:hypothetical protein